MDRVAANPNIAASPKRDLRSAIISLGKLSDKSPGSIRLDLGTLRSLLDASRSSQAHISAKRRANLRSDLTAAIDASGLHPILHQDVGKRENWYPVGHYHPLLPAKACDPLGAPVMSALAGAGALKRVPWANLPGAHELVRQLLGHKNLKTTTNYYAGINTLRAGRAHADLIARLRTELPAPQRNRQRIRLQFLETAAFRHSDATTVTAMTSIVDPLQRCRGLTKNVAHPVLSA
jgi:hypothetical protein